MIARHPAQYRCINSKFWSLTVIWFLRCCSSIYIIISVASCGDFNILTIYRSFNPNFTADNIQNGNFGKIPAFSFKCHFSIIYIDRLQVAFLIKLGLTCCKRGPCRIDKSTPRTSDSTGIGNNQGSLFTRDFSISKQSGWRTASHFINNQISVMIIIQVGIARDLTSQFCLGYCGGII